MWFSFWNSFSICLLCTLTFICTICLWSTICLTSTCSFRFRMIHSCRYCFWMTFSSWCRSSITWRTITISWRIIFVCTLAGVRSIRLCIISIRSIWYIYTFLFRFWIVFWHAAWNAIARSLWYTLTAVCSGLNTFLCQWNKPWIDIIKIFLNFFNIIIACRCSNYHKTKLITNHNICKSVNTLKFFVLFCISRNAFKHTELFHIINFI